MSLATVLRSSLRRLQRPLECVACRRQRDDQILFVSGRRGYACEVCITAALRQPLPDATSRNGACLFCGDQGSPKVAVGTGAAMACVSCLKRAGAALNDR